MPTDTQTLAPTLPSKQLPKLPAGLRWSDVWKTADGALVQGEQEMPVDKNWHIAGRLLLCPVNECDTTRWVFDGESTEQYCTRHPVKLVEVGSDETDRNPVKGARARLAAKIREVATARKQRAVDAANARLAAAQAAVTEAAKRHYADYRGHLPSAGASAGAAAVAVMAWSSDPLLADAAGFVVATAGVVLAYATTYVVERIKLRRNGVEIIGRAARRLRHRAQYVAVAVLAAGVWAVVVGMLGADPNTISGDITILSWPLLTWAAHRRHWEELTATRARLRELARQKAEEAAQRIKDEVASLLQAEEPVQAAVVEEGPLAMGRRMAERWAEIAQSDTVPAGFLMRRTWIIPEETRELTVPDGDALVHVGWEYAIESEPGVLVARPGMTPPLLAARDWLASMLGIHPSLVSLVDRPDDQVNRGLLSITDKLALGNTVAWKGPQSLRREGGAILGHVGADMNGNEIYEFIDIPGQLTGGLTVGHSGGGKSAGARVSLLNDLAAGILPVLYDPAKSLGDFSEFVGVFPMGCTAEHRDVILRSLHAERHRRNKAVNGRTMTDRFNRNRPEPGVFRVGRDGPHIRSYWEEFHRNATDKVFLASFLDLMRVQRSVAMDSELYTQGGGLQDLGDSVIRGLANQARTRLYRMPDNLARLAGYNGAYMPSQLPRVPGACLLIAEGVPPIPLRGAWVTREDEDGCLYDYLYAPDGTPLLTAPKLPKETVEVFTKHGLMDLWERGKGPNGLANLLADQPEGAVAPPDAAGIGDESGTDAEAKAANIVLAIVHEAGGRCSRADVYTHKVWAEIWTVKGERKPPAPSTITRAVKRLEEKDGLIGRKDGVYWITEKGAMQAKTAADVLFRSSDAAAAEEDEERQAELAAEAAA